ncbi:hypothetical protein BH11PSE2_BH11PSE2_05750 [soil metagenome]
MSELDPLFLISGLVAAVCAFAYIKGYLLAPRGFRPLHVTALFSTVMALLQLAAFLHDPKAAYFNGVFACGFLLVSGLAQAAMALRGRKPG